jgi:hypothetical protein
MWILSPVRLPFSQDLKSAVCLACGHPNRPDKARFRGHDQFDVPLDSKVQDANRAPVVGEALFA